MQPRPRDTLLLFAGLPGVVALALSPHEFVGSTAGLLWESLKGCFTEDWGAMEILSLSAYWAAALPVPVAALQLARLLHTRLPGWIGWALAAGIVVHPSAFVAALVGQIEPPALIRLGPELSLRAITAVGLSAINLVLLAVRLRRGPKPDDALEVAAAGGYLAAMAFWLPFLLADGRPPGALAMAWTAIAYLATPVARWRERRRRA